MFENILVCLDDAKSDEAVIPIVTELARRFHSKLILLKIIAVPSLLNGFGEVELAPSQSMELSEGKEEIAPYLDTEVGMLTEKGLEVETLIIEGAVDESIVACAKAYHANLIAVASDNRCKFIKFITGSIIDFVQRKAGIPVLVINPDAPVLPY
jgi:nucleotide-binding universal stress UspA family protein